MAKTIPLKSVELVKGGEPAKYAELIRSVAGGLPPGKGAEIEEIRKRTRILDALDKAGDEAESFDLEDADAAHLLQCLKQMQWAIVSPGIVTFHDDIAEAVK